MTEKATPLKAPKIVVYRSAITDIRTVEARLRRADLDFDVDVMSMAGADERKRYRDLKQSSGYSTLPLIFIDDACIGGEPELARYIAARRDAAPDQGPDAPAPAADHAPDQAQPDLAAHEGKESLAESAAMDPTDDDEEPHGEDAAAVRGRTALLGYAGLLPFLGSAVASVIGPYQALGQLALVAYAAVIFTFVGAVHWGYGLRGPSTQPQGLVASVIPSLIAWVALILFGQLGAVVALAALAASFVAWHIFERIGGRLPAHYLALRLRLTSAVVAVLIGAIAGLLFVNA